jgi:hypothetical protein
LEPGSLRGRGAQAGARRARRQRRGAAAAGVPGAAARARRARHLLARAAAVYRERHVYLGGVRAPRPAEQAECSVAGVGARGGGGRAGSATRVWRGNERSYAHARLGPRLRPHPRPARRVQSPSGAAAAAELSSFPVMALSVRESPRLDLFSCGCGPPASFATFP